MKNRKKFLYQVEHIEFCKKEYEVSEFIDLFKPYILLDNVSVAVDYPGYDGGVEININHYRLETDEEYNKRVEQENLLREKELRKTKQEYKKLKNKLYCLEQQFPEIKNV